MVCYCFILVVLMCVCVIDCFVLLGCCIVLLIGLGFDVGSFTMRGLVL